MSSLKEFVAEATDESALDHPLLTYLKGIPQESVSVFVHRPKDILGYKSAKLYVNVQGKLPQEFAWDAELDDALIRQGIRAQDADNEIMRFALALRRSFKSIETRYGEGFFNAVLVREINETGLANESPVVDVFREIRQGKPYENGRSDQDCAEAIHRVLKYRANEIKSKLNYNADETATIFAGALAQYLDERFSITDGKRFGWK